MERHSLLWLVLALGAALSFAAHNGIGKRALRGINPLPLAFGTHLVYGLAAAGLLAASVFAEGTQVVAADRGFWWWIALTSVLNAAAVVLMFSGFRGSALSASVPFLSLTPVFIVLTGWLILGERVGWGGAASVCCVAAGSYLLNASPGRRGLGASLRNAVSSPGSRNLLAVALIFSVSAVADKRALLLSNLPFFLFAAAWARALILGLVLALTRTPFPSRREIFGPCAAVGGLFALEGVCHMAAVARGPVAYVVAVKRSSVLFSALLGFFAFGEPRSWRVVTGILMMVGGAAALALV